MNLEQWAIRHGVSMTALHELRQLFGIEQKPEAGSGANGSEARVQSELRLNASKRGARLWRNNSGAGYMQDGSFVRWGLMNDSKAANKQLKSPDLIGVKPVLIEPSMCGQIIGQFVARECKPEGWQYTGTSREQAQYNAIVLLTALGADARFANSGDDI